MTIKKIALGVCLLFIGTALAQDTTYTVKQGDTLSGIATKFGTNSKAIVQANSLANAHKLKLGQKLTIPISSAQAADTKPVSVNDDSVYTVRKGDTDGLIAKKLGITAKELHVANRGVEWTKLQIGQKLTVPNAGDWFASRLKRAEGEGHAGPAPRPKTQESGEWFEARLERAENGTQENQPKLQLATSVKPPAEKPKVVQRTYKVKNGDNDWIIAKRQGIKPSELRALNPNVKWTNLQIGTTLVLPGTKVVAPSGQVAQNREPNLPAIRSRYAVVTGDSVTIRRGPSVQSASITTVDRGTRVTVLDREGAWYKLKFPKGTEAWVRGDFLAATKAPQILASNTKKPTKKTTVVASKTTRSNSVAQRNDRNVTARKPAKDKGRPLVVASGNGGNLLEKASSYLGVRYRYGAASRSATDCSGFTTQVFKSQGVKLPRTSREQSTKGQKVAKGELKPGDLVFFNTRGSRVSHVGIYQGNGKFIHASSGKGKVMVSSLNEGYYQRRFAGARRVIAQKPAAKPKAETKVAKNEDPKSASVEKAGGSTEPTVAAPPDNSDDK